jgi:hypothetical protein
MIKKIKPEYRDKLIPVFHYQEDEKWLKNMLEYTHEDGSHIPYIGLAASTVGSAKDRTKWLEMCFSIIKASSNPNVMTHGFGTTSLAVLKLFPLTSADSTTWIQTACHGQIILDEKTHVLSDRRLKDGKNVIYSNPEFYESLKSRISEFGYDIEKLIEDAYERQFFNLTYLQHCTDNRNYNPIEIRQTTLW